MHSQKRLNANRQNAQKSTGPKTAEGKSVSKMNAVKHGLLAQDVVLRGEDPDEFDALRDGLVAELRPNGCLETEHVERIAVCLWRLRRVYGIEAGIFTHQMLTIELEQVREEMEAIRHPADPRLPTRHKDRARYLEAQEQAEGIEAQLSKEAASLGAVFMRDAETLGAISKVTRYEREIRTSVERALHELQRLQAARVAGHGPVPAAIDMTVSGDLSLSNGD